MQLFTYWRSQAAFRVRIALRLKGLAMEKVTLDLLAGDQFSADYQRLNPEGVVPTLIDDGRRWCSRSRSSNISTRNTRTAAARGLHARAHARAIAQMVAMDAHPFIVPRVRKYLEEELHLDEAARAKWVRHWLDEGAEPSRRCWRRTRDREISASAIRSRSRTSASPRI